jgi:hypothetical protein
MKHQALNIDRSEYLKARKRVFGLAYGLIAGLAFALALWLTDAYLLAKANALFPWLKLASGVVLVLPICGLAGWLTMRLSKPFFGLAVWILTAVIVAAIAVLESMFVTPYLTAMLKPELQPVFELTLYENLPTMIAVATAWCLVPAAILGFLEVLLLDQAVFSTSIIGSLFPFAFCIVVMYVTGLLVQGDLQFNAFRNTIVSVDENIQFLIDMRGQEIDRLTYRQRHLAAFRTVQDLLSEDRHLVVIYFDQILEGMDVLIDFDGQAVICTTYSGSLLNCNPYTP